MTISRPSIDPEEGEFGSNEEGYESNSDMDGKDNTDGDVDGHSGDSRRDRRLQHYESVGQPQGQGAVWTDRTLGQAGNRDAAKTASTPVKPWRAANTI